MKRKISTNEWINKYLNSLDIVWVKKRMAVNYYHVGIYLGNNEICHISGDWINKKGIRKCSWETFVEDCIGGEIFGYHPIIPFKNYQQLAKEITWIEEMQWREDDYCLANQNCEHAANLIIYGVEFSKQSHESPGLVSKLAKYEGVNKGKTSVNLKDEINKTNGWIGKLNNKRTEEIQEKYKAQIEVSVGDDCKIM